MAEYQRTVAIVDNDRLTRLALCHIIENDGRWRVIWDRSNERTALLLTLQKATQPDILLLDMSLTYTNGVEVCRAIRRRTARTSILGITAFPLSQYAADLAAAGAQGLITKDSDTELLFGLSAIADGRTYCPDVPSAHFSTAPEAHQRLINEKPHGIPMQSRDLRNASDRCIDAVESPSTASSPGITPLTQRERAVLQSYVRTASYKITAKELGISDSTARNLMAHAKAKLGAIGTAAAIIAWQQQYGKGAPQCDPHSQ